MKKYKDGKMVDISKDEIENLKRRSEKHRVVNRFTASDYEERIKSLEESVNFILSQLNKEKNNGNN